MSENDEPTVSIELTRNELSILYSLIDGRCQEIEADPGNDSRASIVLRDKITAAICGIDRVGGNNDA